MGRVKVRVEITARNVVNTDEIKYSLSIYVGDAIYPRGKAWVTKNVYNYIINDYISREGVKLIRDEEDLIKTFKGKNKVPKWAFAALEKGDTLYDILPTVDFWEQLGHTVDYLNTQDRDWSRISFPQMERLVEQWEEELKKQKIGELSKSSFEHVLDSGPYQWVKILDAEGLKDEGARMQHCCGGPGYVKGLETGKIEIYSLRDKNFDNPHVTIEVELRSREIEQIQGKQNTAQPKYSRNVADFLNNSKFVEFRVDEEILFRWNLMMYKRKVFPYKDLPSSLSLNYSYVDITVNVSSMEGSLHPDVLEGRTIKLPRTDEGRIYSSILEKTKKLILPIKEADIIIVIEKGCNLLKALNNIQVNNVSLEPKSSAGRIKIPSDLTKFKTIFFGGSSSNWDIPDNLKYNIILVRDKSIREAFEKKGIKVDKP